MSQRGPPGTSFESRARSGRASAENHGSFETGVPADSCLSLPPQHLSPALAPPPQALPPIPWASRPARSCWARSTTTPLYAPCAVGSSERPLAYP